jgi:hypothetical protein
MVTPSNLLILDHRSLAVYKEKLQAGGQHLALHSATHENFHKTERQEQTSLRHGAAKMGKHIPIR